MSSKKLNKQKGGANKKSEENQQNRVINENGEIIIHGLHTYNKYKCRCPVCKKANSDFRKVYRESLKTSPKKITDNDLDEVESTKKPKPYFPKKITSDDYLTKTFIIKPEAKEKIVCIKNDTLGFIIVGGVGE